MLWNVRGSRYALAQLPDCSLPAPRQLLLYVVTGEHFFAKLPAVALGSDVAGVVQVESVRALSPLRVALSYAE